MAQLDVSRLHLRAPPALAFRATARAEEALRLAAPEGGRLLVLRRLPLGRLPVSGGARLWEARTGAALREAGARAVHAASPGAAAADAVWFASVAEARWLLLRELVAGRRPDAWFWRLAVPDWGGVALPEWVPRLAAQALAEPMEEIALARAVMRLAAEGLLPVLAQALSGAPVLPRWATPATLCVAARSSPAPTAHESRLAARLLARHPSAARVALLAAIRAAPPGAIATRWLARLALLAAAPEAAAQQGLLAGMTEAIILEAALPAQPSTETVERRLPTTPVRPRSQPSPPDARVATPPGAEAVRDEATPPQATLTRGVPLSDDRLPPSRTDPPPEARATLPGVEHRSRGAGVLLLVRPLARMGLGEWLDRHPALAAAGFARALLRHVARRMRVPPEDSLFTLLGEDHAAPRPPLDAWRIGLDRWLRRRARRRLADVARRPGWLRRDDDSLVIRFAADAADLRLRRQALDVDPGWVPWLGCAVRYHFRDAPQ